MPNPTQCRHGRMVYGSTCLNCKREEREVVELVKARLRQTARTGDPIEDRLAGLKLPYGYAVAVRGTNIMLSIIKPVTIEGTLSYEH